MSTHRRIRPPPKPKGHKKRKKKAALFESSSSPEALVTNPPFRLKQIQYRSYQRVIEIYHFRAIYLSVFDFRNLLRRDAHGYMDTLVGFDTLLKDQYIPPGDEVPAGRIEVAYLPGVFPRRQVSDGSALGFRTGNANIEWFCFERCISGDILKRWVWDPESRKVQIAEGGVVDENDTRLLFDRVASLGKGTERRVVKAAHKEHNQWHGSLWDAKLRRVKVALTWKNFGSDLKQKREEEMKERRVQADQMQEMGKSSAVGRIGLIEEESFDDEGSESDESESGDEDNEQDDEESDSEASIADDRSETLAAESDEDSMGISEG